MPVASLILKICVSLHFSFFNICSRLIAVFHITPVNAPDGQLLTQIVQPPYRLSLIGVPTGNGASVSKFDRRMAQPCSFDIYFIYQKPRQIVYALSGHKLPDKYFYLFSRVKTTPPIAPIRTIGDNLTNSHSNA